MQDETEAARTGSKRLCGGHRGAAGMAVPGAPAGGDALRPAGSLRHPPEPAVSEPVRRVGDLPVQPHGASAGAAAAAERGSVDAVLDPCAHPAVPAEHSPGDRSDAGVPLLCPHAGDTGALRSAGPDGGQIRALPPVCLGQNAVAALGGAAGAGADQRPAPAGVPAAAALERKLPVRMAFRSGGGVDRDLHPAGLWDHRPQEPEPPDPPAAAPACHSAGAAGNIRGALRLPFSPDQAVSGGYDHRSLPDDGGFAGRGPALRPDPVQHRL